jgi:2-polyprenyl-3-methyl-5-hydroxy-6-metoxy-1,4-benzoquinol methylase
MDRNSFNTYKKEFREVIYKILQGADPGRLDEAAFPAYTHKNGLISYLFWERLYTVVDRLSSKAPYKSILDFGCGSGVMLPLLSKLADRVIAMDTDLVPLRKVEQLIRLPENITVYDAKMTGLNTMEAGSVDVIVALDVLEHVDDLDATITDLFRLLIPGGRILVSGPTENWFYKLGRKLAGPEYSGVYHHRSIFDIKRSLQEKAGIQIIAKLIFPIVLFEVFEARKPGSEKPRNSGTE